MQRNQKPYDQLEARRKLNLLLALVLVLSSCFRPAFLCRRGALLHRYGRGAASTGRQPESEPRFSLSSCLCTLHRASAFSDVKRNAVVAQSWHFLIISILFSCHRARVRIVLRPNPRRNSKNRRYTRSVWGRGDERRFHATRRPSFLYLIPRPQPFVVVHLHCQSTQVLYILCVFHPLRTAADNMARLSIDLLLWEGASVLLVGCRAAPPQKSVQPFSRRAAFLVLFALPVPAMPDRSSMIFFIAVMNASVTLRSSFAELSI